MTIVFFTLDLEASWNLGLIFLDGGMLIVAFDAQKILNALLQNMYVCVPSDH
jgi:hypothetical protein